MIDLPGAIEVVYDPFIEPWRKRMFLGRLHLGRRAWERFSWRARTKPPRRRRKTFTPKAQGGSRGWRDHVLLSRLFP